MPDGDMHRFFAKKLINASGPWIDKVRSIRGEKKDPYVLPIAGSHIEIPKFLPHSVILQAKDGRIFFVINVGEKARVGTTEWHCPDPDNVRVPESDVDYLLEALSRYFLTRNFSRENILKTDAGVRPLSASAEASKPNAIPREHEIQVDSEGVLHVIGVKLTDHRRAAEDVVNRLLPDLGQPTIQKKSITAITPLND
jgi:glycerol-3-phosphate dehydrogenase